MTRLFPNPYLGQHPLLPERPPPFSANGWMDGISNGGVVGLTLGLLRLPFGLSGAFTVKAAAYSAVILTAVQGSWEFLDNWSVRKMLSRTEAINIKPKRRALFERIGKVDCDDFIIGGAAIGGLIALSRRPFPGITGWRRFIGISSIGACFGETSYLLYNREEAQKAAAIRKQARTEKLKLLVQMKSERDKRLAVDPKGGTAWQKPNIKWPFSLGGGQSKGEESESEQVVMELAEREPESIGKPHLAVGGDFVPHTDYRWSPDSREDAKATLEDHLRELMGKRDQLSKAAEYIWMVLLGKEKSFYLTDGPEAKNEQRNVLEWLGSMHLALWIELARTSWMIADSTKNLQQLDGLPSMRTEVDRDERFRKAREHLDRLQSQSASALWKDLGQRIQSAESTLDWLRNEEKNTVQMLNLVQQHREGMLAQAKAAAAAQKRGGKNQNQAPNMALDISPEVQMAGQINVLRRLIKEVEDDVAQLKAESGEK